MKTYEVDYLYRVTVKVQANDKNEALKNAEDVNFSIFSDVQGVTIEYNDGYQPEVFEVETDGVQA